MASCNFYVNINGIRVVRRDFDVSSKFLVRGFNSLHEAKKFATRAYDRTYMCVDSDVDSILSLLAESKEKNFTLIEVKSTRSIFSVILENTELNALFNEMKTNGFWIDFNKMEV